LKDVIIRKGENISAKEIEDVLYTHDAISDVAVIGLPDKQSGERVCAVVVSQDNRLTLKAICNFMEQQGLMAQKFPEQLELVAALPRNALGKVLMSELQAKFMRV
jgi:non-ribosomal peptide synthetase component E (peptide arylation enzyme)